MATTTQSPLKQTPGTTPAIGTAEQIAQSDDDIKNEFFEKNPPQDLPQFALAHPAHKARYLARYLEHLADVFEQGLNDNSEEGTRRAEIAGREIQGYIPKGGEPHERLTRSIDRYVRDLQHRSDRSIALHVHMAMMFTHPEVGCLIDAKKLEEAVRIWRASGRGKHGSPSRFAAIEEVLKGTRAAVAVGSIRSSYYGRKSRRKKQK